MDAQNNANNDPDSARARQKALVGLLLKHQRAMFAYIFSMVPHKADADDILQETCLTIHEKFDDFELGTNFLLWANRISYWKIKETRQRYARARLTFHEDVMNLVSETAEQPDEEEDDVRHEALAECLKKLKPRDRKMILARYEDKGGAEKAAKVSKRSLAATYKALNRTRQALLQCVSIQVRGMA